MYTDTHARRHDGWKIERERGVEGLLLCACVCTLSCSLLINTAPNEHQKMFVEWSHGCRSNVYVLHPAEWCSGTVGVVSKTIEHVPLMLSYYDYLSCCCLICTLLTPYNSLHFLLFYFPPPPFFFSLHGHKV